MELTLSINQLHVEEVFQKLGISIELGNLSI